MTLFIDVFHVLDDDSSDFFLCPGWHWTALRQIGTDDDLGAVFVARHGEPHGPFNSKANAIEDASYWHRNELGDTD